MKIIQKKAKKMKKYKKVDLKKLQKKILKMKIQNNYKMTIPKKNQDFLLNYQRVYQKQESNFPQNLKTYLQQM